MGNKDEKKWSILTRGQINNGLSILYQENQLQSNCTLQGKKGSRNPNKAIDRRKTKSDRAPGSNYSMKIVCTLGA